VTDRTGRPAIERYLARPRSARIMAALDDIFFQSSATTSFAGPAERDAFRERWLGRYLSHDPGLAYLALARPGEPAETLAGYLVGSHDDPACAPRFADLGYFQTLSALTALYPAQLHVNLAPEWRSMGLGHDLVAAFVGDARAGGVPGVHVVTSRGMRNVGFYAANGFQEVGACAWNGHEVVMLGLKLT
jgi:GNAT superfamily N-acetyltransferase